jgi:hypothetical protein
MTRLCTVPDCGRAHKARGFCNSHYHQFCGKGKGLKTGAQPGSKNAQTHGLSKTPAWSSWSHMKDRCNNQRAHNYSYYGGRGISVCDRWQHSFENFYADMGPRPEGRFLERIDNDGNYEPGNCKWATKSEQMRNRGFRRESYKRKK